MAKRGPGKTKAKKHARAGRSNDIGTRLNLSGVSIVANNLNGQPLVFKTLNNNERRVVRTLTGHYPKWWDPTKRRFKSQVTTGIPGKTKTLAQWASLAAGLRT